MGVGTLQAWMATVVELGEYKEAKENFLGKSNRKFHSGGTGQLQETETYLARIWKGLLIFKWSQTGFSFLPFPQCLYQILDMEFPFLIVSYHV